MGGPMGVYDDEKYSWLRGEKVFIKQCIDHGKKVLDIYAMMSQILSYWIAPRRSML
jgi:hypothetical protein